MKTTVVMLAAAMTLGSAAAYVNPVAMRPVAGSRQVTRQTIPAVAAWSTGT